MWEEELRFSKPFLSLLPMKNEDQGPPWSFEAGDSPLRSCWTLRTEGTSHQVPRTENRRANPFVLTAENRRLNSTRGSPPPASGDVWASTCKSGVGTAPQAHTPRAPDRENNGVFSTNYPTAEVIACLWICQFPFSSP